MIIAIIIVFVFLILFFLCRKVELTHYKSSSKILSPFLKISIRIVERILNKKAGWIKNHFLRPQVVEGLKQINPTNRTFLYIKKYYVEKIALSLFVLLVCSILTIVVMAGQKEENILIGERYLQRGDYTEGKISRDLQISVGDKIEKEDIRINVEQQELTENEVFESFTEIIHQIDQMILGDNTSFMEIRSNLILPKKIENSPVGISWNSDCFEIIESDGTVNNEELEQETNVILTATLRYEDYTQEYEIPVKVLSPVLSETDELIKKLQTYIQSINQENRTNEYLELPKEVEGNTIVWSEPEKTSGIIVFILGIFTAILIYYVKDKELEERVKKREQQLLVDYPNIVSKLTLLLGAGMTVKGAWEKVVINYREKRSENPKSYRYGYEEMLITYYEMKSGVSEMKAYEDFGKRARNQRYLKLSSLITQNLRKGSKGLSKILESESLDALEDRKAYAKTAGEEAGTKLMGPMFLNLILVIIIIMIPACMSFQM